MVDTLRHDEHLLSMLKEHHYEAIMEGYDNSVRLMRRFLPQQFRGDILLFVATKGEPKPSHDIWAPYVGGKVKIHRNQWTHEAMMDPLTDAKTRRLIADELNIRLLTITIHA